jgi:hypothetical protein
MNEPHVGIRDGMISARRDALVNRPAISIDYGVGIGGVNARDFHILHRKSIVVVDHKGCDHDGSEAFLVPAESADSKFFQRIRFRHILRRVGNLPSVLWDAEALGATPLRALDWSALPGGFGAATKA